MGGTSKFDPYHKWLGIPLDQQPANHYRLLGLRNFEHDADVIESALETFRERAARAGVRIEQRIDCEGALRGDPEQLRRVVINRAISHQRRTAVERTARRARSIASLQTR